MSTIKTTYIQHPSSGSPNIELAADGTVVLPLSDLEDLANVSGTPSDGQYLEYDSGSSSWQPGTITFPDPIAGIGSNVVSATKTDRFTHSTQTFTTVPGLEVTITPTSSSSKILILGHISSVLTRTGGDGMAYRLVRGGTPIAVGSPTSGQDAGTGGTRQTGGPTNRTQSFVYLDSPATTSATTYSVQVGVGVASVIVNQGFDDRTGTPEAARTTSNITVIEVAS